jgi:hypothetical protein
VDKRKHVPKWISPGVRLDCNKAGGVYCTVLVNYRYGTQTKESVFFFLDPKVCEMTGHHVQQMTDRTAPGELTLCKIPSL